MRRLFLTSALAALLPIAAPAEDDECGRRLFPTRSVNRGRWRDRVVHRRSSITGMPRARAHGLRRRRPVTVIRLLPGVGPIGG